MTMKIGGIPPLSGFRTKNPDIKSLGENVNVSSLSDDIIEMILYLRLQPDEKSDPSLKGKFNQITTREAFKEYFGIEMYGEIIYVVGTEYLDSFEPHDSDSSLSGNVNYMLKIGKLQDLLHMLYLHTGEKEEFINEISLRIQEVIKKESA